jgi:4-aminobutyrate aminotransferase-like enzyme
MLIVDSVFTSGGVLPDPAGFLRGAVAAIRQAGGLFVADEVQPGFGRTGQHMWGYQRHGVVPDILTMGKPMGNGQPIAGLLVTQDAVARFGRDSRYFNTFGGNTVSCAAAVAVLDTIEQEGLIAHAAKAGAALREGIAALAARHEAIGDVRGVGMFVGVEIVSDRATRKPDRETTSRVVNLLRDKGILLSACAKGHNVLKIRPPLVLTREQVAMVVQGIDEALAEAVSAGAAD